MTEKEEMKMLLAEALKQCMRKVPLEKITVTQIVRTCGTTRQTFYRHFQDKYELLSYCLDETAKELDRLMETHAPKDFFIVLLSSCQEKEKVFYHIFEADLNKELMELFYQFFSRYITLVLDAKLAKGALLPGPVESVAAFYVSGLVGMTLRWIKSNYQLPKETLAACQYRLMKDIL